jgi:hypothetical protein
MRGAITPFPNTPSWLDAHLKTTVDTNSSVQNNFHGFQLSRPNCTSKPKTLFLCIRDCNQKFPDWLTGTRTANGTALCH